MGEAITHLRYVAMAVPDLESAVAFYARTWGLALAERDGDVAYLAAEGSPERYVYRLRRSGDGSRRLDCIGFGSSDADSVDELATRLGSAGIELVSEPSRLETPGGGYGFRFFDPDGRVVEVSCEVASRTPREVEPREAIPVGLSHVVVNSPQREVLERFYRDQLGFQLSDWLGDGFMSFWRCNAAHHSLAIVAMPFASVNHVAFEVASIDDMLRGAGRVLRDERVRVMWGPGRHSAGDNTFFYFFDPFGSVSEYTSELLRVSDGWEARAHDEPDVWGVVDPPRFGPRPADVPGEQIPGNDPGLWAAPPV